MMSPLYFLLLYLQKVFCRVLLTNNHIEVKNTGSSQIAVYGDIAWTLFSGCSSSRLSLATGGIMDAFVISPDSAN